MEILIDKGAVPWPLHLLPRYKGSDVGPLWMTVQYWGPPIALSLLLLAAYKSK